MSATQRMISIMPTVDGRRRSDLHHAATLLAPMRDERIGEEINECLNGLAAEGLTLDDNIITLEVKFA